MKSLKQYLAEVKVIQVANTKVYRVGSYKQIWDIKKTLPSGRDELRGLLSSDGKLYVWNSWEADHRPVAIALGFASDKYNPLKDAAQMYFSWENDDKIFNVTCNRKLQYQPMIKQLLKDCTVKISWWWS